MRPLLSAFVLLFSLSGVPFADSQKVQQEPSVPPQSVVSEQATSPVPELGAAGAIQTTAAPSVPAESAGADQQQTLTLPAKSSGTGEAQPQPSDDTTAVTLDANGKPVELSPCAKKDKECVKKRKALLHRREVGMKIENGTLTVDGWTGKAHLNYDIHEVRFLYISVPGVGTIVASMQQFPNSVQQKDALQGKTLTLKAPDDHTVQLSSDETLVDKKEHPFFVLLDRGYVQPGRFPSMGYGTIALAPYNWPGVRPMSANEQKLSASAPPLPSGMQAQRAQLPCQKVGPGERPIPVKINGTTMTPEVCNTPVPAGTAALGTRSSERSGLAANADPSIKN